MGAVCNAKTMDILERCTPQLIQYQPAHHLGLFLSIPVSPSVPQYIFFQMVAARVPNDSRQAGHKKAVDVQSHC